jgi:hypothetical protein
VAEAGIAREPHLVLAHVADVDALVLGQLADPLDDVVRGQEPVPPVAGAVPRAPFRLALPLGQLVEVRRASLGGDRLDHRREGR